MDPALTTTTTTVMAPTGASEGSVAGLADLAAAVTPTTLAGERALAVDPAWRSLIPEGVLVRGRTVAVTGLAAPTLGLSLVAGACRAGAWLAQIDLPWLGTEAAAELGIPIERLVRVDAGRPDGSVGRDGRGELWVEVVAAAIDGFDLVLTRVPSRAPAGAVRRLQTRLRHRGGLLVVVGDPGPAAVDVEVGARDLRWEGVGRGHGHLRARRLTATVSGRRVPRPRSGDRWLPAAGGGIAEAAPEPTALRPRPAAGPGRPVAGAGRAGG